MTDSIPPIRIPEPPRDRRADSIVINQTTFFYFVIAALFTVAGFVIGWVTASTTINSTVGAVRAEAVAAAEQGARAAVSGIQLSAAPAIAQPTPTPIPRQVIEIGDSPSWGPTDAKVTIVEWSDFQCVYCAIHHQQAYQLIKQMYGDKIRFVYKHFPYVQTHPQAYPAALAAECANEQGKFWEYHDALFTNQQDLSPAALVRFAGQVGIANIEQFNTCYETEKYKARVDKDITAGEAHFVNGTPIFYINGYFISGARPFAHFQAAIDAALAQAEAGQG